MSTHPTCPHCGSDTEYRPSSKCWICPTATCKARSPRAGTTQDGREDMQGALLRWHDHRLRADSLARELEAARVGASRAANAAQGLMREVESQAMSVTRRGSVSKTCGQCGSSYGVSPSRATKSKYCSSECRDNGRSSSSRRAIICESCGEKFKSRKDHGKWPRFCSRACWSAACVHREPRKANAPVPILVSCDICETPVPLSPSKWRQRYGAHRIFCSTECRAQGTRGEANRQWKGGTYITKKDGFRFVRTPSGYIAEHRMIAERILGRYLDFWSEPIIHLNGVPADNRPENLHIFPSMSAMKRALEGTDPFPQESNLSPLTYDEKRPRRALRTRPKVSHGAGRRNTTTIGRQRLPGETGRGAGAGVGRR